MQRHFGLPLLVVLFIVNFISYPRLFGLIPLVLQFFGYFKLMDIVRNKTRLDKKYIMMISGVLGFIMMIITSQLIYFIMG